MTTHAVTRIIPLLILPLALLSGCGKANEKPADEAKAAPPEFSTGTDSNGETVVTLNDATQKRIGLEVAPAAAAELPAVKIAYGSVMDPAPLLALHAEIASDQAALDAAAKVAARARALFADDENVARKSVDAAEADEKSARLKLDAARQSLRLEWGDAMADLSEADRGQLVDSLAGRRVVMVRVDLRPGDSISNLPPEASISPAGEDHWTSAQPMAFASTMDPKTLGQGVVLRVALPGPLLAPGAAAKALLPFPGPRRRGVLAPESAALQFEGRSWIYEQVNETNFTRREVALDTLLPGGWFTTNGLAAGDKIVTTGAAILLSQEQKSQSPAGAD